MILILLLGVLVQVHRNGYFLRRPRPNPPVLGDSGLVRLARVSPHPPASRAPPQKAPKAWWIFGGFSRWNFGASQQVVWHTPKKSVQESVQHLYKQFLQAIRAEIRTKKSGKKPCKKSVQKIRAKNPCRKSVQKIRAENPCKKSMQKICAKQTRANGFPKVTLQIEKPKILW